MPTGALAHVDPYSPTKKTTLLPLQLLVMSLISRLATWITHAFFEGYKVGAAKTLDEYANLDKEDESLARWKASLGIVPGASGGSGPKVSHEPLPMINHITISNHIAHNLVNGIDLFKYACRQVPHNGPDTA